jgi:hypothetical protein
MRTTIAKVNAALKAAGHDAELVRGRGYFYFVSTPALTEDSVNVFHLGALTVDEWVAEYEAKLDETNRGRFA